LEITQPFGFLIVCKETIRKFYRDVLGCEITKKAGDVDYCRMGDNFVVTFWYEDSALSEPEWVKSIWLEIKADDVLAAKKKMFAFGVKEVNSRDKVHLYFQAPGEMIWPGYADSWYSKKRSTLGAALIMAAPGIPMIFMGQEFLCGGWFDPSAPLDWSNAAQFPGITQLYRDLIHLRRNWFNNTRGLRGQSTHVHHVDNGNKVIAYHRWDQGGSGDDVIVVLNFSIQTFSNYTIGFPRNGTWRVRLNSDWNGYDASFANSPSYDTSANGGPYDSMPFSGNIGVGPYSAVVLTQD
jgi:glycosidase